jgi:hypothetical protein
MPTVNARGVDQVVAARSRAPDSSFSTTLSSLASATRSPDLAASSRVLS